MSAVTADSLCSRSRRRQLLVAGMTVCDRLPSVFADLLLTHSGERSSEGHLAGVRGGSTASLLVGRQGMRGHDRVGGEAARGEPP